MVRDETGAVSNVTHCAMSGKRRREKRKKIEMKKSVSKMAIVENCGAAKLPSKPDFSSLATNGRMSSVSCEKKSIK